MIQAGRQGLIDKVFFFYKNQREVHISYLNGKWKRGIIYDVGDDTMFQLYETIDGEIPVFYSEIKDIQPLRPKDGK